MDRKRTITSTVWVKEIGAPYPEGLSELFEEIQKDRRFKMFLNMDSMGEPYFQLTPWAVFSPSGVDPADKGILNGVIKSADELYFGDFLKLVLSTYPLLVKEDSDVLDLVKLAEEYRAHKEVMESAAKKELATA